MMNNTIQFNNVNHASSQNTALNSTRGSRKVRSHKWDKQWLNAVNSAVKEMMTWKGMIKNNVKILNFTFKEVPSLVIEVISTQIRLFSTRWQIYI